jgi:hypothetical protein
MLGPSHFFGRNISVFGPKYLCFGGKVPKFGMENCGKVPRKQLQRTCPKKIFYLKINYCPKNFFQENFFAIGAPKKCFAPDPRQALGGPESLYLIQLLPNTRLLYS